MIGEKCTTASQSTQASRVRYYAGKSSLIARSADSLMDKRQPLRRLHNNLLPLRPIVSHPPALHAVSGQCCLDCRCARPVPPHSNFWLSLRSLQPSPAVSSGRLLFWSWLPPGSSYIPARSTGGRRMAGRSDGDCIPWSRTWHLHFGHRLRYDMRQEFWDEQT